MDIHAFGARPAGYSFLEARYSLRSIPHWHSSSVSSSGTRSVQAKDGHVHEVFSLQYWPGETLGDHLEFALKYDGVNLALLALVFECAPQEDILSYIASKPTGKYARRIWFFYEWITERELPLPDLNRGNYVDALEGSRYYTIINGNRSARHRVVNNLLGPKEFCPIVRKTELLERVQNADLKARCEEIVTTYPSEIIRRALSYLYKKETKSSFEIEHITPQASRAERFIAALQLAEKEDFCEKERLVDLQNRIVDPRFKDGDYRKTQNYVGQTAMFQKEIIHYITPKPSDLPMLMQALIDSHKVMMGGEVPPLIHAAVIVYGFVFLHPFEDGNGRIHRFLIHNILSLRQMIPQGLMFPVSAVMLKNQEVYDASLEAFSKPLLQLIDYHLGDMGRMTVESESSVFYTYIDMTLQAEALSSFVEMTIEEELVQELTFLSNYDAARKALQEIIDMPDRLMDLFINLCLQNNGRLSASKRSAHFSFLTDDELVSMERVVRDSYHQESR